MFVKYSPLKQTTAYIYTHMQRLPEAQDCFKARVEQSTAKKLKMK